MPKQVSRLLIVFGVFVVAFFVARHFLVPESFGELGHYRANALEDISKLEPKYMGIATCVDCHDSIAKVKEKGNHKTQNCETCHGPGYKHEGDPSEKLEKPTAKEFCLKCHSKNASRPKFLKQIISKEHNPETNCIECHNPHQP